MQTAALFLAMALLLTACGGGQTSAAPAMEAPSYDDAVQILLSDSGITANGTPVGTDDTAAVYTANDIVYYMSGMDISYGEGTEADAHTPEDHHPARERQGRLRQAGESHCGGTGRWADLQVVLQEPRQHQLFPHLHLR